MLGKTNVKFRTNIGKILLAIEMIGINKDRKKKELTNELTNE